MFFVCPTVFPCKLPGSTALTALARGVQEKGADFIDYDCTSLRVSDGNQGMQGINPANQLRLVVYPIIYDGFFYIPGGWEWDF